MTNLLLTQKFVYPSAKILRDALQDVLETRILVTHSIKNESGNNIILRYGNSDGYDMTDSRLNTPETIHTLASKKRFSRLLREAGLNAPIFYNSPENLVFPLVIRETLFGSRGKGIHIVKNEEQFNSLWRSGFYWTPFVNVSKEYRVHVARGEMIRVFEKILTSDAEIRNGHTCHFSLRNMEGRFSKMKSLVERVVLFLGSRAFFALDVAILDDGSYFIFEGNSAPGLTPNTARAYAEKIKEML